MIEKILRSRLFVLASLFWTASLGVSLAWNLHNSESQVMEMAYAGRANLNKDDTLRRWEPCTAAFTCRLPIPRSPVSLVVSCARSRRDDDRRAEADLVNPASMLRQMMDLYAIDYGIRGRITGLRYLNPGNAPDVGERTQPTFFAWRRKEVWEIRKDRRQTLPSLPAGNITWSRGATSVMPYSATRPGPARATGLNLPLAPIWRRSRRRGSILVQAIWRCGWSG